MVPYVVLSMFSALSLLLAFGPVYIIVLSIYLFIPLSGSSRIVSHSYLLSSDLGLMPGSSLWGKLIDG